MDAEHVGMCARWFNLTLVKGDEGVEAGEEGANSILLPSRGRQRENGIEEVVGRDVEQTMVPRALSGNHLDGLVPAVSFVVRNEKAGIGSL